MTSEDLEEPFQRDVCNGLVTALCSDVLQADRDELLRRPPSHSSRACRA